jgi:ATP-dependent RNA helicase RhlE
LLEGIEKLLKRQISRVSDTGYEPVSLKVMDAPKKNAPAKTTGKKDFRHHDKKNPPRNNAANRKQERNKANKRGNTRP